MHFTDMQNTLENMRLIINEFIGIIKMAQLLYFNNEHCILALHKSIYQQWLLVITGMGLAEAQFVFGV